MANIKDTLAWGAQELKDFEAAPLEAEILLAFCLQTNRTHLYTYPEKRIEPKELETYQALIAKRKDGMPIAYITGEQEFWSLPFKVTPDVLIPRADTETLVECVLTLDKTQPLKVIDLGTGSGAIACALAHSCPIWEVFATDISQKSLEVAKTNVQNLKLNNVRLVQGAWLEPFDKDKLFDCIVSNPPYIDKTDKHLQNLTFEPLGALVSDNQGLKDLNVIITTAMHYLKSGGLLALEHGFEQGELVRDWMQQAGFKAVHTLKDIGGCERVTRGLAP